MFFLVLFVLLGLVFVIYSYMPIISKIVIKWKRPNNLSNEILLQKFGTELDEREKAISFVSLMESSYVLVHLIVNKGNNYNDKAQSLGFSKSLTPTVVNTLKNLEKQNGQYTF